MKNIKLFEQFVKAISEGEYKTYIGIKLLAIEVMKVKELSFVLLFQLCNLLLEELKISSDEKILSKLQNHVNRLIELGMKNKLPNLIVESLWFKAQLSLLNLDFEKGRELLNQALSVAEEKGYNFLALKMMKSKEELINQTMELEEIVRNIPTISKRMDAIKIENDFKKITSSDLFQLKQNI